MGNPLISVVIPAFRSGLLIREAIDSVMAQTFRDFEIVVVDNNASEDTSQVVLESMNAYPGWIRMVYEPVQGNPSARNRGISEARGRYIALLDDDDKMYPNRLEFQLEAAQKYPEVSLVHGRIDFVDFTGTKIISHNCQNDTRHWADILFGEQSRYSSDPYRSILPSTSFFHKDHAMKLGMFDMRFNPLWVEDTEFSLRMWESGPFYEVPYAVVAFRLPSSDYYRKKRSSVSNWFQPRKNLDYFFSKLVKNYYVKGGKSRPKFRKIRSRWLRETAQDVLRVSGGGRSGRVLLKRAIADDPLDFKNWKWYLRSFLPEKYRLGYFRDGVYLGTLKDYVEPVVIENLFQLPDEE